MSVAVGGVNPGAVLQPVATFAPCPLITGGVISPTVMVWLTVDDWLPQASTALHVLVLV
jgi:hypothetical protein